MLTAAATLPADSSPPSIERAADRTVAQDARVRAPMRSFFWRIFFWFWLAALLLTGAVAATVYFTDPDQFFPRSQFVPMQMIDRLAGESVGVYEQSGAAAVRSYLVDLPHGPEANGLPSRAHFDNAYLFDADTGDELAGQSPRFDTSDLVRRAAHNTDLQLQRHIGRMYMAHAVAGKPETGRRYVFLMSMPRSSLLLPTTPQVAFELGAAVLVSALVCYWLAHSVVSPLRQLQAATRRLAEGDLGARVSATGGLARRRDEFSVLARDFDEMAARIEDLLTAQKRLIGDISHELGSPLTRLNVALGLAFRKTTDAARPELDRIQTEAGRLNDLIRQLLLISELESSGELASPETINLREMVAEIAADAEFEAGGRRCRVTVRAPDAVAVQGVRHLLRSAVENVVRNAVRYTAEDSEVSIELQAVAAAKPDPSEARALIRVRDRGPGVPAPELANLFQPFYRVSEARSRATGGTGLGLAITQRAVQAHGGAVRATNVPEGGLMVEIDLPTRGRFQQELR